MRKAARAFVLGPPRDIDKIDDLDPIGDENFGDENGHGFGTAGGRAAGLANGSPFPRRHVIPLDVAFTDPDVGTFFIGHYGPRGLASWRRRTARKSRPTRSGAG